MTPQPIMVCQYYLDIVSEKTLIHSILHGYVCFAIQPPKNINMFDGYYQKLLQLKYLTNINSALSFCCSEGTTFMTIVM